jgi:hypothetical protein
VEVCEGGMLRGRGESAARRVVNRKQSLQWVGAMLDLLLTKFSAEVK